MSESTCWVVRWIFLKKLTPKIYCDFSKLTKLHIIFNRTLPKLTGVNKPHLASQPAYRPHAPSSPKLTSNHHGYAPKSPTKNLKLNKLLNKGFSWTTSQGHGVRLRLEFEKANGFWLFWGNGGVFCQFRGSVSVQLKSWHCVKHVILGWNSCLKLGINSRF